MLSTQSFTSKQVGAEVCCELHAEKLNANINTPKKKLKCLDKISAFNERESKLGHLGSESAPGGSQGWGGRVCSGRSTKGSASFSAHRRDDSKASKALGDAVVKDCALQHLLMISVSL